MYVEVEDVRNAIGVTSTTTISDDVIMSAIEWSEDEIDRLTNTTYYPAIITGTATTGDATLITDTTKQWTADAWIGYSVYIYSGTGNGQIREITDNAATTLTTATWTTTPDTTSKYYITYSNKITELYDGNNKNFMFLKAQPLVQLDALTVDSTAVTTTSVYQYDTISKIQLSTDSEVSWFTPDSSSTHKQIISVTYWYGVLSESRRYGVPTLPRYITRLCTIMAGLKVISYQLGGSYNNPQSFTLPDFSSSVPPAYAQFKSVIDVFTNEVNNSLEKMSGKYTYMA